MLKSFSLVIVIISLLSGCASVYVPEIPAYQAPKNAKIGVMINLDEVIKHTHIGTTIFNNQVKDYDFSWSMEQAIFETIKTQIESNSPYQVVNLKELGYSNKTNLNFTSVVEKKWHENETNTELKKELLAQNIYSVINIKDTRSLVILACSQYGCTEFYSEGYGLFTKSFFGLDSYYASASFNINAEFLSPAHNITIMKDMRELVGWEKRSLYLDDFEDPKNFENITKEEMLPVKTKILEYFEKVGSTVLSHMGSAGYKPKKSARELMIK